MDTNQSLKLLVVDDEESIVAWVQRFFSERGFITFGTTDGITAVELFQKERPHITIIDVHMPYSPIDGVETLERIKQIDKEAICIMVTRITEKDKMEASRELGALRYITKPLTLEELHGAVNKAVSIIQKRSK